MWFPTQCTNGGRVSSTLILEAALTKKGHCPKIPGIYCIRGLASEPAGGLGDTALPIEYTDKAVFIDSERLDLMAGEVHYWRLESRCWELILDRLLETGIRMVSTYVPWRVHMPVPSEANFGSSRGDSLDLRAFLELAKRKGLKVFLRPGPLIVSEMTCGGLPDYLFEDESILVRNSKGEIPKGGFAPLGTVSYLHPRYLEHCRQWLSAVYTVVKDFFRQNGGPIILLQLDNEVSYVCHDGMFVGDYNEAVIGKDGFYHRWLERKYGGVPPYVPAPKSVADVEPPRELGGDYETNLRYYLDWAELREDMMAEYLAELRRIWESLGVRDVVYVTNYNPHNAISVPTNWAKMEAATTGITGYDFYKRPYMPFREWERMALVCAYSETATKVPWSPEFMSGIWGEDFGDGFGQVPAEHFEFMSLSALAFGLKGLNYYMFAEREEWAFCPVNQFGQKRYAFDAVKKVVNLMNTVNLSQYEPQREVGLLFSRPYGWISYMEDPFPPADNYIELGQRTLDGDRNAVSYNDFESLFSRLLQLGFLPRIIDPDLNPEDLSECSVVLVPTQTRMDEKAVRVLEEYAGAGGRVLFSPEPPSKDLWGNVIRPITWGERLGERLPADKFGMETEDSLNALSDALGVRPSIRSGDRFVLPVLLGSPSDRLLFLMNVNPRAKRIRLEVDADADELTDFFTGETFERQDGAFEVEVDAKMCRVLRVR